MEIEVTFLTRKGRDAVLRKSQRVTLPGNAAGFGRGADKEVQLTDIRVNLAAADLEIHDDHLTIRARPETELQINGSPTIGGAVNVGDKISIGPYDVVIEAPPEGAAAAVTVELVKSSGDTLQRIVSQARLSLDRTALNKRIMSWSFFAIVAALFLVLPIVASFSGDKQLTARQAPNTTALTVANMSWNVGEISAAHRHFSEACTVCHRSSFSAVPDSSCLNCHANVGAHMAIEASLLGTPGHKLDQASCGSCHEEHRGPRGVIISESAMCVTCHGSIETAAPNADVRNVRGFPNGHPQFRATLVADAALGSVQRMEIGGNPKPTDHPNLKFSHAAHLIETGFLTRQGRKVMVCADCHVPEPSGQGFMPMTFKGQCQSCHDLKFDADLPWKEVPHGDDTIVRATIEDFYGHQALRNGVPPAQAGDTARRVAGAPADAPSEPQRRDALSWVAAKTADALTLIYNDKRGCAYCHILDGTDTRRVLPVSMRTRFLPQSQFDHSRHTAVPCAECHDSRHSEKAEDVLIPGLESCTSCHGGEKATFRTPSNCTTCHSFHRDNRGPMRPVKQASQ